MSKIYNAMGVEIQQPETSQKSSVLTATANVERITLKNGQHAWKSDQGVFYPWSNGKIGLDEVPAELL